MLDVVYSGLLLYLSFRFTTVMNIVIVISNWTYSFAVLLAYYVYCSSSCVTFSRHAIKQIGWMNGWLVGWLNE